MPFSPTLRLFAIVLTFLTFFCQQSFGQYYDAGQDPASIKWLKLKTPHCKVIFPSEMTTQAQRIANLIEKNYPYHAAMLGHQPKPISIILHNRTVISNGFVAWAPKRSEFYTCPEQSSYAQDWLEQLVCHEYRHVEQIDKLNTGPTKALSFLLGEQGTASVLGLYVPTWFLEGDAVCAETALSKSGRGRLPNFSMPIKAQVMDKKIYSYDKAVLGSYMDFIPGRYELGYQLVAGGIRKYGYDLWSNTLKNVARNPYAVQPFSRGIKKSTGLSKTKFYRSILDTLNNEWKTQTEQTTYTPSVTITKPEKNFTNYQFPLYVNDSLIVAEKSGMDNISRFVTINKKGKEKRLLTPGQTDGNISYNNQLLCWAETHPDPRWEQRTYSVIKTYNFQTKRIRQITHRSRYFSPSISNNSSKIAVVDVSITNECSLKIIDSYTGKIIKSIAFPSSTFIMTPTWAKDDSSIVLTALDSRGKYFVLVNSSTNKVQEVGNYFFTEISNPILFKHYILFTGAFSGISNIYALDVERKEIYQITSVKYGADNVHISNNGEHIIYSDYDANGYKIAEANLSQQSWKPLSSVQDLSVKLYESIPALPDTNTSTKTFKTSIYHKWFNILNPHSWAPASVDADKNSIAPGFSIMSQNKLSTAFTTIGYDLRQKQSYLKFSYKALLPVIDFVSSITSRSDVTHLKYTGDYHYSWLEYSNRVNVSLPFNLTQGKYFQGITPILQYSHINLVLPTNQYVLFPLSKYGIYSYQISAYRQLRMSIKDIAPKWGQSINFLHSAFSNSTSSALTALIGRFYLPSFIKHNSLNFYVGIQSLQASPYRLQNNVVYPRGYNEMDKLSSSNNKMFSLQSNYAFPICYPDLSLGSLVYIKRIKANLFYDYTSTKNNSRTETYTSSGLDLSADLHVLRLPMPISIGVRTSYLPEKNITRAELLFNINFAAF